MPFSPRPLDHPTSMMTVDRRVRIRHTAHPRQSRARSSTGAPAAAPTGRDMTGEAENAGAEGLGETGPGVRFVDGPNQLLWSKFFVDACSFASLGEITQVGDAAAIPLLATQEGEDLRVRWQARAFARPAFGRGHDARAVSRQERPARRSPRRGGGPTGSRPFAPLSP